MKRIIQSILGIPFCIQSGSGNTQENKYPRELGIPEDLTARVAYKYKTSGADFYNFAGSVYKIKGDNNPVKLNIVRPPDFRPIAEALLPPPINYSKSFELNSRIGGGILSAFAGYSENYRGELTFIDVAKARAMNGAIQDRRVLLPKLKLYENIADENTQVVWVEEVFISRQTNKIYKKIEGRLEAAIGNIINLGANAYLMEGDKNESLVITFILQDVPALCESLSSLPPYNDTTQVNEAAHGHPNERWERSEDTHGRCHQSLKQRRSYYGPRPPRRKFGESYSDISGAQPISTKFTKEIFLK